MKWFDCYDEGYSHLPPTFGRRLINLDQITQLRMPDWGRMWVYLAGGTSWAVELTGDDITRLLDALESDAAIKLGFAPRQP